MSVDCLDVGRLFGCRSTIWISVDCLDADCGSVRDHGGLGEIVRARMFKYENRWIVDLT